MGHAHLDHQVHVGEPEEGKHARLKRDLRLRIDARDDERGEKDEEKHGRHQALDPPLVEAAHEPPEALHLPPRERRRDDEA